MLIGLVNWVFADTADDTLKDAELYEPLFINSKRMRIETKAEIAYGRTVSHSTVRE